MRAEIDAILQDELDLDRRIAHQAVFASIEPLLPADLMTAGEVQGADADAVRSRGPQSTSGSLDKLIEHLQVFLGRVRDRRRPLGSSAGIEQ